MENIIRQRMRKLSEANLMYLANVSSVQRGLARDSTEKAMWGGVNRDSKEILKEEYGIGSFCTDEGGMMPEEGFELIGSRNELIAEYAK